MINYVMLLPYNAHLHICFIKDKSISWFLYKPSSEKQYLNILNWFRMTSNHHRAFILMFWCSHMHPKSMGNHLTWQYHIQNMLSKTIMLLQTFLNAVPTCSRMPASYTLHVNGFTEWIICNTICIRFCWNSAQCHWLTCLPSKSYLDRIFPPIWRLFCLRLVSF